MSAVFLLVMSAQASASSAQTLPTRSTLATPSTPSRRAEAPATLPSTDTDWLTRVTDEIRAQEYDLSAGADRVRWTAPNRAHDLRAKWLDDGALVLESRTAPERWTLYYRLQEVRRGKLFSTAGAVVGERVEAARLERNRNGLDEWYVNGTSGLEVGFTIHDRPLGPIGEAVVLVGELLGMLAYPFEDGQGVLLRTDGGIDALRISGLKVTDARDAQLTACLDVSATHLNIVIDDRTAVYPLKIYRLLTGPAWAVESDHVSAQMGKSVATAGDVNGDGYSDVIVGASDYDSSQTRAGRAWVYHGSAGGLSPIAAWTAVGDQAVARFGGSVATAGDVNGDGYSDVVVGAWGWGYDSGEPYKGRAYVYLGSPSGLGASPAWTAEGEQAETLYGYSVASAGDVNGDGYSDVIVGAPQNDNGQFVVGRAFVYYGSAGGLAVTAAWTADGEQYYESVGYSVASAGDVNGDGFGDVIIGAPFYDNGQITEGRALVFHGSSGGLGASAAWTVEGNQEHASAGFSVATAGDVNGDGYGDVIVGTSNDDAYESGRAMVYYGSAGGLISTGWWVAFGNQDREYFGASVATAGDVNGDGFADVIIGAFYYDNGAAGEGGAFVYYGSATGLGAAASWTAEGDQYRAYLGWSVATAGDVDGDGYSDVIAGAPGYRNGEWNEGRAVVYHGSADGLDTTSGWTARSGQAASKLGYAVATAGDVNGDGYSDVIVGAPEYDNGETDEGRVFVYHGSAAGPVASANWTSESDQDSAAFGDTVATAGDVNGDGYSDVIIGAPLYDNGETDEGRAFVYHGSASGLGTSAAWTAESDQNDAWLGDSVAAAGDVNGDGFGDVIVGVPGYDNGQTDEGRALVYYGSASGLTASPAWAAEGDQDDAFFGGSAAAGGDVNGDGYSDVIVGAWGYDNGLFDEGRAFVYHGSASGLAVSPDWIADGAQYGAEFGISVATAGDVDGDGYSDVVIGAQRYDNGDTDEGRAFVFRGSANGVSALPAWTAESDQASAFFGRSVATAGDVNGDGYSDVIVGAYLYDDGQPDEGRAFVYHGSASGLGASPAWTAGSNQLAANFASSVATAGDVNGDGYSDIIVGAPAYDSSQVDEGRVSIYYGNGGDGLDRIPRQARGDGSAPIDILGHSATGDFRVRANGRTPFGRDQVRLEWEVKPLSTPFNGVGIRVSNWLDTGAPTGGGSAVLLDEYQNPLPGGPSKWRLRLRSRFPFPWQSHWMSMPNNNQTETDLRPAISDLQLTKRRTSGATTPPGETVTFNVLVENTNAFALFNGILGDTLDPCFDPLGSAGNPCPIGPGVPSVSCVGASCAGTSCTITNGGLGFILSGFDLDASDGVAGGSDQLAVTVDVVAGSTQGWCNNLAGMADPTDGTITSQAMVFIGSGACRLVERSLSPPVVPLPPPWVYSTVCSPTDSRIDNTVVISPVTPGSSIDTMASTAPGPAGQLTLYQVDCSCGNDVYLTKNSTTGTVEAYTAP